MEYTYFGVFFFFSSLHLWELEVENLSVVVCKTQTLFENQTILEIKLNVKQNYFLLITLHYKVWGPLTLAFSSSSVHFTCES